MFNHLGSKTVSRPSIDIPVDDFEEKYVPPVGQRQSVGVQTNIIYMDESELTKFKNDLSNDFQGLRRNVLHKINKLNDMLLHIIPATSSSSNSLPEIKSILNLESPITDLEAFYEFDKKIRIEKELTDSLRELMSYMTRGKTFSEAIASALSSVMSPELQMKFSACGKPNKGVAKENLSATKLYTELKDHLLKQFENEKDSTILSKTSRWLANAKERSGGRNLRKDY